MLDIKFIRDNRDIIAQGAKKKRIVFDLNELINLDDQRRDLLASIEKKRAEQNLMNSKITRATPGEREVHIVSMRHLKEGMQDEEEKLKDIMKKWQTLMLTVPNIPDVSVPEGEIDEDNKEIKTWGSKPVFDFEPKDHIEIMTKLSMADFERGTKVHGFRGYFLTGDGVRLCFAIWNYALAFFSQKGFNPVIPPMLARSSVCMGTGYLPQGEDDLYKTQDGDYLVGTSEVPLMGMHMNEVIEKSDLPIKYLGFSPCYRREAGSHSKDTKGLIRVHEFYKFEQLVLCEAN